MSIITLLTPSKDLGLSRSFELKNMSINFDDETVILKGLLTYTDLSGKMPVLWCDSVLL